MDFIPGNGNRVTLSDLGYLGPRRRSFRNIIFGDVNRVATVGAYAPGRRAHVANRMARAEDDIAWSTFPHHLCGWSGVGALTSLMRVNSMIQLVSQVLPPSGENACSQRAESAVMLDQINRTYMLLPSNISWS